MKILNLFLRMATVALLMGVGAFLNAQVTIGSGNPPAATLDVVASAPNDNMIPEGVIVPRLTKAQLNAKRAAYTSAQLGANVYITDVSAPSISGYSDQVGCVGFAYWNGVQWITNCAAPPTYIRFNTGGQPKAFSFYEEGTETPAALTINVSASSAISYQWYIVTGSNIHVPVARACTASDGAGFNTPSFTPTNIIKGTTRNAANNGFYRYYCVATNLTGETVTSDIAEVAVGCGAKDMFGNWVSFMCFNLGAEPQTMAAQRATVLNIQPNPIGTNNYLRSANERTVLGDLFQWGRIADGHENRDLISLNGTGGDATDNYINWRADITYENGNILGTGNQAFPYQQITRNTDFYGKFVRTYTSSEYNWYYGDGIATSAVDQLWRQSAFAPNDPCQHIMLDGKTYSTFYPDANPSSTAGGSSGTGWRIPTQDEWGSIFLGGTGNGLASIAMANTWVRFTGGTPGYNILPDGVTTTLFLPFNGDRSSTNALLTYTGITGYYWSGSIFSANAVYINLTSTRVSPAANAARGNGMGLRCIKN